MPEALCWNDFRHFYFNYNDKESTSNDIFLTFQSRKRKVLHFAHRYLTYMIKNYYIGRAWRNAIAQCSEIWKKCNMFTSYPNLKSKFFLNFSGVHHRLRKWVQMMILTRIWIWPIGLMSPEPAVFGAGCSRLRAASTRNCQLWGH